MPDYQVSRQSFVLKYSDFIALTTFTFFHTILYPPNMWMLQEIVTALMGKK